MPALLKLLAVLPLAVCVLTAAAEQAVAPPSELKPVLPGVPRSTQVAPGIYRGGQPTAEGLRSLKEGGFKTIISLRHPQEIRSEDQPAEMAFAVANGITYKRVPMTGVPTLAQVLEVYSLIQNSPKPVLVHCLNGSERSGVMMGYYRMRSDGWTLDQVLAEANSYDIGFRTEGYRNFLRSLATHAEQARAAAAAKTAAPVAAP